MTAAKPLFTTKILQDFGEPDAKRFVLLSCSLFKMAHSYRFFGKYENYLAEIIKHLPAFTRLCVYVDMTTAYLASKREIVTNPNIQIIQYDCPSFHIKSGAFHDGTFGTLMRFLPCFEPFPLRIKYVWVTDIDIDVETINLSALNTFITTNADIMFLTYACYLVPWSTNKYPIVASKVVVSHTFPRNLIENFVADLDNGSKYGEKLALLHNFKRYPGNKQHSVISRFPYGTDELFLNEPFAQYMKHHLQKAVIQYVAGVALHTIKYSFKIANIPPDLTLFNILEKFENDMVLNTDNVTVESIKQYISIVKQIRKMNILPPCLNAQIDNYTDDNAIQIYNNSKRMKLTCIEKIVSFEEITLQADLKIPRRTPKSVRAHYRSKRIRTHRRRISKRREN